MKKIDWTGDNALLVYAGFYIAFLGWAFSKIAVAQW